VLDVFSLARHNRTSEVSALLDKGIPVDVKDKFGNTLLCVACQNGLKKMAKLALRRGADINAPNVRVLGKGGGGERGERGGVWWGWGVRCGVRCGMVGVES
jgi:hypothetical protein